MNTAAVLDEFRQAGALQVGHFILSSGLHSPVFLQKALIFQNPRLTAQLCAALADKIKAALPEMPEIIVAPAMGGVIPGYELARQLDLEAIYTERENGKFVLRRGFSLKAGQTVLVMEDIMTTGLSLRECMTCVRENGGEIVGIGCLFDRSAGEVSFDVPLISLAARRFPAYAADNLPPELAALPAVKPGSRGLA